MRALLTLLCLLFVAPLPARAEPAKLCVMYFENSGANEQLEMLKLGLAQMLITDLSQTGKYEVVERTRLNEVLAELELQKSDAVDPATAVQAGKLIGAHYMVLGGYFELMGQFRVDARVVDVQTGQLFSVGSSGTTQGFMEVQKAVGTAIEGAIADAEAARVAEGGEPRVAPTEEQPAKDEPSKTKATDPTRGTPAEGTPAKDEPATKDEPAPSTAASSDPLGAAMAFSEGLDLLDRKDLSRAKEMFSRALELDPALDDARTELAALSI